MGSQMHGPGIRRDEQIEPAHGVMEFLPAGAADQVADLAPERRGQQGGKLLAARRSPPEPSRWMGPCPTRPAAA